MNEVLAGYKAEMDKAAEKAIRSVERKKKYADLGPGEVESEIKKVLAEQIIPISERYDNLLSVGEVETVLGEISKKIRSAFVPNVIVEDDLHLREEHPDLDDKNHDLSAIEDELASSKAYRAIREQVSFYKRASADIGQILEEIEQGKIADDVLISRLAPFIDIFFKAGLQVQFKIEAKSDETEETVYLHQNDTVLLKDIATAIQINLNPSLAGSPRDIDSLNKSVFGRLQIPNEKIPTRKAQILRKLVGSFFKLVPDIKSQLNVDLFDKATKVAIDMQELHESSISQINEHYDDIFATELKTLKVAISRYEADLTNRGYQKGQINEKEQKMLSEEFSREIRDSLLRIGELRRPFLEEKSKLNDLLHIIGNYESAGRFDDKEQEKLLSRAKRIHKSFEIDQKDIINIESLTKLRLRINEQIDQINVDLKMYDFFQEELIEEKSKFIEEWGLNTYLKDIESMDVEKLTPWQIVTYVIGKEVAFWTPLHQESDNEFLRAVVDKVKYNFVEPGKGYESVGSRNGTDGDWWSTSEGATIMGLLQVYGLFATVLHGEHFAEGDKTKLFSALRSFKITREKLYVQTLGHPVYGKFLDRILEISQNLPALRTGSLPSDDLLSNPDQLYSKLSPGDVAAFKVRLQRATRGVTIDKKALILHERHVVRNGRNIKLAADRFVADEGQNWAFYPGEEMQPGDKLILTADSRFSYPTLSGNIGRIVAQDLHEEAARMIETDPERFGLTTNDIPKDENYRFAAMSYAQFLFYSFPFLTNIYAQWQQETMTAAHIVNVEDLNWNRLLNPLGEMVQDADRYGLDSPLLYGSIYYTDFKDGTIGASGNASRMRRKQRLLKAHQLFKFGKSAMSHVLSKIDAQNSFASPGGFTSALEMLRLRDGEVARLFGNINYENGKVNPASAERPHKVTRDAELLRSDSGEYKKGTPAYDWDLFLLSARAFLRQYDSAINHLEPDSITTHQMETNDLNPINKLLFKDWGQFKMWFFGSDDDPANALMYCSHLLFHTILRHIDATKKTSAKDTSSVFSAIKKSLESALGDLGSGQKVSRGLGNGQVSRAIRRVLNWMSGYDELGNPDHDVYDDGEFRGWDKMIAKASATLGGAQPKADDRMTDGVSPEGHSFNDKRQGLLVDYLKLLWEDLSENFVSKHNPVGLGRWPFPATINWGGLAYTVFSPTADLLKLGIGRTEWIGYVDFFKDMLLRKEDISSPFPRPKGDK